MAGEEPKWRERYWGGSAEVEYHELRRLAQGVIKVQYTIRKQLSGHGVPHPVQRAFHAKSTLAVDDAELRFNDSLPADLIAGFAKPAATYRTTVRFSNAAGREDPDFTPDLRGVALRIHVDESVSHDLLATNYPVSHARNASQFVEFANATAGGRISVRGLEQLLTRHGLCETVRMFRNVRAARNQQVHSVASQTYWSRGAIRWGPTLAVRYLLRPAADTPLGPEPSKTDASYLSAEAAERLRRGEITFDLCVQRYVDEKVTPIEDTAVAWTETCSPAVPVGMLTLKQTDLATGDAQARGAEIDGLAFNPWNTTDEFRPLGNLNRARKVAYDASAAYRGETRWLTVPPTRNVILGGLARAVYSMVNRRWQWYELPTHLALLNLDVFRQVLRAQNLIDSEVHDAPRARPVPEAPSENDRAVRTADGRYNDLSDPEMGKIGAAFGRNLVPDYRTALLDRPNPIEVSTELLTRHEFLPARSMSLLAAAWIQFQVHDWVNHPQYELGENDIVVPLPPGMPPWRNTVNGLTEAAMRIPDNKSQKRDAYGGPLFENGVTHWWDGSELYGSDATKLASLRDGPRIRLENGYLPVSVDSQEITGFGESWWLGLSALHTLFAREHNAVCSALRGEYPHWTEDRLFHTARLVVSALIAKIHTVEWTPAILATEPIDIGLKGNWNGPPSHDWLTRLGIWLVDAHSGVGIPKTEPDHNGVPYSLTEDFVAVYRLHPLIPDDYRFFCHLTGKRLSDPHRGARSFDQIAGDRTDEQMRSIGLDNVLYSFGIAHPGAITLNNYPQALRRLKRRDRRSESGEAGRGPGGEFIDLAVVDIVRSRRRGIPRYNDFRAGLHKPRLRRWEDLSEDRDVVRKLRKVYSTIDEVDTMIGLFAEPPPPGFGFSDTAFRIFILMASRRIQSDRFLTADFRPEVYTPLGMDWIEQNSFGSVISRHCPGLATLPSRGKSPFAPWRSVVAPNDIGVHTSDGAGG